MDETKLKKLGAELEKARARQAEWTAKVKDLERKYREAENTCIHDMVHAANLTPEHLAELIRAAAAGQSYTLPADAVPVVMQDDADDYLNDIDEEKEEIEG